MIVMRALYGPSKIHFHVFCTAKCFLFFDMGKLFAQSEENTALCDGAHVRICSWILLCKTNSSIIFPHRHIACRSLRFSQFGRDLFLVKGVR